MDISQNALNWNCGSFWLLILHSFGSVLRQLRVLGRHPSWNANCRKEKHHLLWSILACFECQQECYDVLWPWSLKTWHERSEALFDEAKQVLNLEICFSLAVKVFQLRTLYPAHHALRRITFGANHWADCYSWEYQESTTRIHRKLLDSRELGSRNKKAEMPAHLFMQIKQIIHCNNCFVARLDTEAERVLSFTWHHYLEPLWRLYALSRLDSSVWTCWRVQSPADHLGSCWISNSHTESHLSPIRYPGEDDENPEGALGCGSRTSSGAAAKPWNHGTHGTGSSHKIYQAQAAQISWNIVKLKWAGHSVPRVLVIGWYPFWIFFKKLRPSHLL